MPDTTPHATAPYSIELTRGSLLLRGKPLLSGLPPTVAIAPDPAGVGAFLTFTADAPADRLVLPAGQLAGVGRFTACHRYEPFWMYAKAGTRGGQVPVETQSLLAGLVGGGYALIVPMVDTATGFRSALQGAGEHGIEVVAESGDPAVVTTRVVGLFVAGGDDPYALTRAAAPSVAAAVGVGRLRAEKALPRFLDHFGWCTWDAFYQDVSHDKVREGLDSFRKGGVQPKVLILDDGWQSESKAPAGNRQLTAFAANAKFPGDLAPTVRMAKQEFGVTEFLVWHAMMGYWGGVDGSALPGYGARPVQRRSSPGTREYASDKAKFWDHWWGPVVGLVPPEHVYRFFSDYHRHLRAQGVDGVKVDTQAALETLAHATGGRVDLMRRYHEALEGSAHVHFKGELINCMSCASEMLYGAPNSSVTRTSTDFWPNKPESHGLHLYTNAQVSVWFGQFVHPDWDMFQSAHAMGPYHAAARAVSGGPVYVSDKVGQHNFDVLRKLVLPDGSVLRCRDIALPTRDCLLHDALAEPVLLKLFNTNAVGGVVAAFNARYGGEGKETDPIPGHVSPADVEGLAGDRFAVYAHHAKTLHVLARDERLPVTLKQLTCEVFTVVPIVNGFAPIGLPDLFNSGGALVPTTGPRTVGLRWGGRFLAYCEAQPKAVTLVSGQAVPFTYDAKTRVLDATVKSDGPCAVTVG